MASFRSRMKRRSREPSGEIPRAVKSFHAASMYRRRLASAFGAGSVATTSRPRARYRAAQLAPMTPVPTIATFRIDLVFGMMTPLQFCLCDCSRSCDRCRLFYTTEVWWTFLEECRKRFLALGRAQSHRVLLIFRFCGSLQMLTSGLPHQSLAGLQRFARLFRQLSSSLSSRCEELLVRYDSRD